MNDEPVTFSEQIAFVIRAFENGALTMRVDERVLGERTWLLMAKNSGIGIRVYSETFQKKELVA